MAALARLAAAVALAAAAALPSAAAQHDPSECMRANPPPWCPQPPLPPPLPTPPRQTPTQRKLIAHIEHHAKLASDAAKPAVLGWLGSQVFLDELDGCCAEVVAMAPEARLAWIAAEFTATEMVHNFGQSDGGGGPQSDETIRYGNNATFFYNLWEIALMGEKIPKNPSGHNHTQLANCTQIDSTGQCGNGHCTPNKTAPMGYSCRCRAGFMGDNCENPIPVRLLFRSFFRGCFPVSFFLICARPLDRSTAPSSTRVSPARTSPRPIRTASSSRTASGSPRHLPASSSARPSR